ncbi:hypothetical protein [Umezawaea sp. Da 62-37]|uniref:hypothetical protein n=1 Tax=Umezawaea sp. Da 62-37 TaxID=3075927 RepID=UPI0028F6DD4A|nr:hypothetical protein [Umezawaea sp. Da 62-37]WNV86669.1 hypothetical protein RM788_52580 [Umezawaea sp. Da 62-37]WNV86748.1 hypothetical protein RM788_00225 [Umezawaea sp. Da 62-37]
MSLRPGNDVSGPEQPEGQPIGRPASWVGELSGRHFWRGYLVFVTALTAFILFAVVTGSNGPIWAGVVVTALAGTGAAGAVAKRRRR